MDIVEKLIVLRDIGITNRSDRDLVADAANEITRLRAALKKIQAYSVGDRLPRHTWYYDFAQSVLIHAE